VAYGQVVTVQPHVPSARLTHSGPAVVPSAQILVGASGRGPEQLLGVHEAWGGGHVVTVQPHVPSARLTHSGPAVVPSAHSIVGDSGPGPGQLPGPHGAFTGGGGHDVIVQPQVPSARLAHVGPAVVPSAHSIVATAGRGPGHVVHAFGALAQVDVRLQLSWSPVLAAGASSSAQPAAKVTRPISRKE
jgi:hypothetical protein